jgi:hypothetical protein
LVELFARLLSLALFQVVRQAFSAKWPFQKVDDWLREMLLAQVLLDLLILWAERGPHLWHLVLVEALRPAMLLMMLLLVS